MKIDKSQFLCKNFQSKSEFSTRKETIKAHWENKKSLVSYACPEHFKSLKKCDLPRSTQALDKDQPQWYVTSNIHLLSYFFWVCSSNKHFTCNWANSACRNKQSLFCNRSKSFEACTLFFLNENVLFCITAISCSGVFVQILCQCLMQYGGIHRNTVFISPAKLKLSVFIQLVGILIQGGTIIIFRGMSILWESNFISPMLFNLISSIHLTLGNEVCWTSVFILWKAPPSVKAITQLETISKGLSLELLSFFKGGNPHLLYPECYADLFFF